MHRTPIRAQINPSPPPMSYPEIVRERILMTPERPRPNIIITDQSQSTSKNISTLEAQLEK
jgi:hypothetical protein